MNVYNLYLTKNFALRILSALQESDLVNLEFDREVLPALENIFLEELVPSGPLQQIIEQFVSARCLYGHPTIVVSQWIIGENMSW